MTDELLALRLIVVSQSPDYRHLLRRAAAASKVPVEIAEADDTAAAALAIAAGAELVFLDMALGNATIGEVTAIARAAIKPPFTVLLSALATSGPFPTDALAIKPPALHEAKRLVEKAARVRSPTRVLLLDDSATMRSIMRRILVATRFPLELSEADQGGEAIELARKIDFDIVFLDYNLPGFNGLETMAEFRREKRNPMFVLITSTQDEAVRERALAQGAAFLKKPFFPTDIEALLCDFYGLRALNPHRA